MEKIQCQRCKAFADLVAYTLTDNESGHKIEGVVPVTQQGEYLCELCMNTLRTTDPKSLGTMHIDQYRAAQHVKGLAELTLMADDLIRRAQELYKDDNWDDDADKWIRSYKRMRGEE